MENRTKQKVSIGIKAGWSVFGMYREILTMSLKSNDIQMSNIVCHKSISKKKLEKSQRAMERKVLYVQLKTESLTP